jgi:hypothetical protein
MTNYQNNFYPNDWFEAKTFFRKIDVDFKKILINKNKSMAKNLEVELINFIKKTENKIKEIQNSMNKVGKDNLPDFLKKLYFYNSNLRTAKKIHNVLSKRMGRK